MSGNRCLPGQLDNCVRGWIFSFYFFNTKFLLANAYITNWKKIKEKIQGTNPSIMESVIVSVLEKN